MDNELHIVGIQTDLFWEDPTKNLTFFEEKINSLPINTDIVVLPEMFTTGFTMNPAKNAEKIDGISVCWMQKIAIKKKLAITGSLVIEKNNKYYNMLIFAHPSGKIETYIKRHSFTFAGENTVYTSGEEKLIITYKGWKICPLICYDLRFPVWARNIENYDLLIFMANWPVKRIKAWELLLKARSIENMCYTIGVNRTGIDANKYSYSGNSLIIDYLGTEISNLPKNEIGVVSATIDRKNQDKIRTKLGFLNDMDSFTVSRSK
jgi:omega-amidase